MPAISPDVQANKNIVTLQFLCEVPILDITPPLAQDDCAICKDPYRNNAWRLGGTVHRPVILRCGHVFGFQCLARWMLSANHLVARCPLCRADVMAPSSEPAIPGGLADILLESFARLQTLGIVAAGGISRAQRSQLLRSQESAVRDDGGIGVLRHGGDRVMVAWEEILNSMCRNGSAAPSQVHTRQQQLTPRGAVARQANDGVRFVLSQRWIQIALYCSFMAMAYVMSSPVWEYYSGRADTFTAAVLSAWLWLGGAFVACAVWRCDVWRRGDMVFFGVMSGVALAGLVRVVEDLLHAWWMKGKYNEYIVYY